MNNEFFNYYALSDSVKADILHAVEKTLVGACLEGDYDTVVNIIDNVNEPGFINKTHNIADLFDNFAYNGNESFDLLTIAAVKGHEGHCDIIKKLLGMPGIDPNIVDSSGKTALIHHCETHDYNDYSMLENLLDHVLTNVYIKDRRGFTALDYSKKIEINNLIKKRMTKDFVFLPVPTEVLMNIMDFYQILDANAPKEPINWEAMTGYPPGFGPESDNELDFNENFEEYSDYESD